MQRLKPLAQRGVRVRQHEGDHRRRRHRRAHRRAHASCPRHRCEVFEQADAIRELGVGINTLPHAIKELAQIGLLPGLDAVGIRTHELFYMNRNGQEIWREPRGTDAGFGIRSSRSTVDACRP